MLSHIVYFTLTDNDLDIVPKTTHDYNRKAQLLEETSQILIAQLRQEGLSDSPSDFLLDHGPIVQSKIEDSQIRGIDVWTE